MVCPASRPISLVCAPTPVNPSGLDQHGIVCEGHEALAMGTVEMRDVQDYCDDAAAFALRGVIPEPSHPRVRSSDEQALLVGPRGPAQQGSG